MFSIGEFARHGRVSVRMLRHYHAIGVLVPTMVDPLSGYRFYQAGQLSRTPVTRGTERFIDPGAIPVVSSNGTAAGIVWLLSSKGWRSPDRPAVLHAYDAANVAQELYNSHQNSARDEAGRALRFAAPMIVNGRVYVGAKSELDVYGLIAPGK